MKNLKVQVTQMAKISEPNQSVSNYDASSKSLITRESGISSNCLGSELEKEASNLI
jgi:hypothetical protein